MRHEGTRAGFESVKYKGREYTTHSGTIPDTVPNKRIRMRGTIATPLIHDMPAHISELRDWRVEYYVGTHKGLPLYLPAARGPWVKDIDIARALGHSPGYRLLVRDTDTDTYVVERPPLPGNTDTVAAPVSKRSKMMAPKVSAPRVHRKVAAGVGVGVEGGVGVEVAAGVGVKVADAGTLQALAGRFNRR